MEEKRTLKHISEDEIRSVVANSTNWSECCRKLGLPAMTGTQTHFKQKCIKLGLDHSHFVKYKKSNYGGGIPSKPIECYLDNTFPIKSNELKKKLFKLNLKERKCEICDLTEWYGKPAPLELDHKDSNHLNNNLDNLQVICANCHSIETTRRRANRKQPKRKYISTSREVIKKQQVRREKWKQVAKHKEIRYKIQWPTDEELERLVWEVPTSMLCEQLGVSDVAIGKRCKKLGIQKPPVGYWAKIQHGHTLDRIDI